MGVVMHGTDRQTDGRSAIRNGASWRNGPVINDDDDDEYVTYHTRSIVRVIPRRVTL